MSYSFQASVLYNSGYYVFPHVIGRPNYLRFTPKDRPMISIAISGDLYPITYQNARYISLLKKF